MTTTYTSGLRLTNQPEGGNANTWGQIADTNFEHIDDALTGNVSVDLTGGASHTLTTNNGADDEARNMMITVHGIPTSANSVIIPSVEKMYLFRTAHTSVSGGITIRTAGGTGQNYLTGQTGVLYCDGVSVYEMVPQVSALDPSNNLSDVENASASRANLEMGDFVSVSSVGNGLKTSGGKLEADISVIFEVMYPVGSLYMNRTDNTNPGTLIGFGTWTSAGMGRVPIGVGTGVDVNGVSAVVSAQTCGGEYEHTLTTSELIAHDHFVVGDVNDTGDLTSGDTDGVADRRLNAQGGLPNENFEYELGGVSTGADRGKSSSTGSSEAFNIQQPWYSVYMWVRTS